MFAEEATYDRVTKSFSKNDTMVDLLTLGITRSINYAVVSIGEAAFQDMQKPAIVGYQRAASLRFADPRVQGLSHALLLFLLVQGVNRVADMMFGQWRSWQNNGLCVREICPTAPSAHCPTLQVTP